MKMPDQPNTPESSPVEERVSDSLTAVSTPEDLNKRYLLPQFQEAEPSLEKLREVFDLEKIKSLSTEAYIELLKKYPSDMLTHVTRQGVRDHAGTIWHKSGLNERANGFMDLLESGAIKSTLGRDMEGVSFDEMVRKFCKLDDVQDRFSACEKIRANLENTSIHTNSFADRSSVHFASSVVMDRMYGGETGNEIFFVLPSVTAASNNKYSGRIEDGSLDQNNDVWVYADPEKGVELDTGFCFIPKDAKVSPENGSLYEDGGSLAHSPIRSEEYWEGYFKKVGKKPKHIIYYDSSSSPTDALYAWEAQNGISADKKITELEEAKVETNEANDSKTKEEIKKHAYEIIDSEMPVDDAFLEKVFQYEESELQTTFEVNFGTYLLTDEDTRRYEQYRSKKKMGAFYESMSPGYTTLVQGISEEQTKQYNKYLEDLYEWQEGSKRSPPPFNPIVTTSIPPPLPQ
jgi:hypothetical protein